MPGNLLFADKQFPSITGDDKKDIKQLYEYIYKLQEELRYTMGNLGKENFNEAGLDDMSKAARGGSLAGMAEVSLFSADASVMEIGDIVYVLEVSSAGITAYTKERQPNGTITTIDSAVLFS